MYQIPKCNTISTKVRDSQWRDFGQINSEESAELLKAFQSGGIEEAELWMDSKIEEKAIEYFGPEDARVYFELVDIGQANCKNLNARNSTFFITVAHAIPVHQLPKRAG